MPTVKEVRRAQKWMADNKEWSAAIERDIREAAGALLLYTTDSDRKHEMFGRVGGILRAADKGEPCPGCRSDVVHRGEHVPECDGRWIEHESGIDTDAGDVGGDYQCGPAVSRRWHAKAPQSAAPNWPAEQLWYVVTWYVYPVVEPQGIEEQREFVVCTDPSDPGSTEVWSVDQFLTTPGCTRTAQEIVEEYRPAMIPDPAQW